MSFLFRKANLDKVLAVTSFFPHQPMPGDFFIPYQKLTKHVIQCK